MDGNSPVVFTQTSHFAASFPIMEEIRRQGKLCDITLKVGDHSFSAHRIVLAAAVPYFHAMFTTDMVECHQKDITMKGIDAIALEALINFVYSGRIAIDHLNVQSLMVGASFLQLTEVRDACADFLSKRLHPQNVLGIKSFADALLSFGLVRAADDFIHEHFSDVSKGDEFLSLEPNALIELIKRDDLRVSSEEQVFEAVMSWVKKDPETRSSSLPSLLVHVRLPLLSPRYLADHVAKEDLIRRSHECRDLVDEARDYHLMPERRSLVKEARTHPRCGSPFIDHIFAVGGLTKSGDSLSTVESYDPTVGRWSMSVPMRMLRSRVGVGVMRGQLYAFGGYNGSVRLSTVEAFNPVESRWKRVPSMHCKRSAVGAASLDDRLYVCGGYDGIASLNSVECYKLEDVEEGVKRPTDNTAVSARVGGNSGRRSGRRRREGEVDEVLRLWQADDGGLEEDEGEEEDGVWEAVALMSKHRSAGGVVAFQGHIYALGGHDGLSIFDSVERYDPLRGQWKSVSPMSSRRCRLGAAALNGRVYACGGYGGSTFLSSVEAYDPRSDRWSAVKPMNVTRSRVALVSGGGCLWAVGGYDGAANLSTMETYDPRANEWTFAASMCAHEGGVGVGILPMS
ncbi:kelch-like protein 18 [Ischnura elegans]|uniref:kelch-like protein 18 n=1 Tax=Ischnura elegans TaxID=197161 RepID=UPI001ED8B70D|nr:kelch-like protein 18 [Ischnura elegans]